MIKIRHCLRGLRIPLNFRALMLKNPIDPLSQPSRFILLCPPLKVIFRELHHKILRIDRVLCMKQVADHLATILDIILGNLAT